MNESLKQRVYSLFEERIAARFLGRVLDRPTVEEIASFCEGLKSRIDVVEGPDLLLERDERDPTSLTVHFPEQIESLK